MLGADGGRIVQFAWVVPDLGAAARRWHALHGVGPFLVNRRLALADPHHRGRPVVTAFSTAVAQSGDIQIELVEQHDDTRSAYRDTVPAGTTGFHHVAVIAADYDAMLRHYAGFAVAAHGRFGDMRFSYVDTSATLGHMVEIVEDKPAIRAFFAAVRKAAERWDGDPATLLRDVQLHKDNHV